MLSDLRLSVLMGVAYHSQRRQGIFLLLVNNLFMDV